MVYRTLKFLILPRSSKYFTEPIQWHICIRFDRGAPPSTPLRLQSPKSKCLNVGKKLCPFHQTITASRSTHCFQCQRSNICRRTFSATHRHLLEQCACTDVDGSSRLLQSGHGGSISDGLIVCTTTDAKGTQYCLVLTRTQAWVVMLGSPINGHGHSPHQRRIPCLR